MHYDAHNQVFNAHQHPICPLCETESLQGVRHKRDMEVIMQLLLYAGVVVVTTSLCSLHHQNLP